MALCAELARNWQAGNASDVYTNVMFLRLVNMLIKVKLWFDFYTRKASTLLSSRRWFLIYLGAKWVLVITILVMASYWAYNNDAWLILIVPIIAIPKFIKDDFVRVRYLNQSRFVRKW